MSELPAIYVFCNQKGCDGRGDWHVGMAIAEDGTCLAQHVSSNHWFVRADLGNNRLGLRGFDREKEYSGHYPNGYRVVWLGTEAEIDDVIARLPKREPDAADPRRDLPGEGQ